MSGQTTPIPPPRSAIGDPGVAARLLTAAPPPSVGDLSIDRFGRTPASRHVLSISKTPRQPKASRARGIPFGARARSLRERVSPFPAYRDAWRVGSHAAPLRSPVRLERGVGRAPEWLRTAGEWPHTALLAYLRAVDAVAGRVQRVAHSVLESREDVGWSSGVHLRRRTRWRPMRLSRPLLAVSALALAVFLPIQGFYAIAAARGRESSARRSAADGEARLLAAASAVATDPISAAGAFGDSERSFENVLQQLRGSAFITVLAHLFPRTGAKLEAADAAARVGVAFSRAGKKLSHGLAAAPPDTNLLYKLTVLRNAAAAAAPEVSAAAADLENISIVGFKPDEAALFSGIRTKIISAAAALSDLPETTDAVLAFLGSEAPKRYLLIFQNSAELRPTGGFIGSIAEVTVSHGQVERLVVPPGGAYDLQGDQKALVLPPEPLRLVTGRWQFHDANWFPDFPTSARKLEWFFGRSGGTSPDGVIAVTADALPDLLRVVGPVALPDGSVATADTVLDLIRADVDARAGVNDSPKQVIADLAPAVLERLTLANGRDLLALASVFSDALASKRVQIFANDPALAAAFASRGYDGALRPATGDSVALVTANIGGGKTDPFIHEELLVETEIGLDGRVVNTVTMKRAHTGRGNAAGNTNIAYLRLYVPAGSSLLAAEGDFAPPAIDDFEPADSAYREDRDLRRVETEQGIEPGSGTRVTAEFGHAVFGNWMRLEPGETKTIRYRYALALPVVIREGGGLSRLWSSSAPAGRWSLRVWHQPGAERRAVRVSLHLPPGYGVSSTNPPEESFTGEIPVPETRDLRFSATIAPLD